MSAGNVLVKYRNGTTPTTQPGENQDLNYSLKKQVHQLWPGVPSSFPSSSFKLIRKRVLYAHFLPLLFVKFNQNPNFFLFFFNCILLLCLLIFTVPLRIFQFFIANVWQLSVCVSAIMSAFSFFSFHHTVVAVPAENSRVVVHWECVTLLPKIKAYKFTRQESSIIM